MILRCSMHNHTTLCDGKNTPQQMLEAAIAAGCETFGFSGHAYMNDIDGTQDYVMSPQTEEKYIEEILNLKELYGDRIEVLLGIEQDYFSPEHTWKYDYVIGSVHGVFKSGKYMSVDCTPDELKDGIENLYSGDVTQLYRDYYSLEADVVNKTDCDIIGHFDIITKFNQRYPFMDTESKEYRTVALEALDALIPQDRLFEVNTGAVSRNWLSHSYPQDFLMRRLAERGANIIITSDAHKVENVLYGFDDACKYAVSCGFDSVCIYKNKKIEKIKIC